MEADKARFALNSVSRLPRWRRRLTVAQRRGTIVALVERGTVVAALAIFAATAFLVIHGGSSQHLLQPWLVALLLVANLVPVIGIMVLLVRRLARKRAGGSGGGRLHVRLVATFSMIAAFPTLAVVIFASLLFQYGVAFWFSDSARTVLQNANHVAQAYVGENRERIEGEIGTTAMDLRGAIANAKRVNPNFSVYYANDDARFPPFFVQEIIYRSLSEAALVGVGRDGEPITLAIVNVDSSRTPAQLVPKAVMPTLDRGGVQTAAVADRMEARIAIDPGSHVYLYVARHIDPLVVLQSLRAKRALGDYVSLLGRSRSLQFQFNAALLIISLLIVGAAIWIAFTVADRLTRPISDLVGAARRVTLGDLSVRVPPAVRRDEVGTLATAFNRMTRRIEEQTGALVGANRQLDERRAFTEAVLSGVSAGVLSVDAARRVQLSNQTADTLLNTGGAGAIGRPLGDLAPELDKLIGEGSRESIVQLASGGEMRTLAVTLVASDGGHVLTFDDITQQLLDQRRAAWSDVARRIAHEIKNPLTPIQLAAERLQRRYGKEVTSDPAVFERLTQTIVRQVGDLRRMVDEFSSFARVPKPVFRPEPIVEVARQALFLHEVAHPTVRFTLDAPDPSPVLVCDRRLLGQALTNIVKNAVEAIQEKAELSDSEAVAMTIREPDGRLSIEVADTGIGLPAERERLTEPYMTTRARGTGLGLAIVKKIVEEHFGTIAFLDRPGGGTVVRILLDAATLAPLAGAVEDHDEADETRPTELTRMKAV